MAKYPWVDDSEYTGPRWRYGCTHRPPGGGGTPRGAIVGADRPDKRYLFGTIDYPRQLTPSEVYDYELTPMPEVTQ